MPVKGKKRTLENDTSSPVSKKSSNIDDRTIIESALTTAAPTAKQLDPEERQRKVIAYKNFLNRGGPDAPRSKEIPKGASQCLQSLTFVITGVLPSLEREECKRIIESYGGRVTTAVSGRTNYLLAGRDVGKMKIDKAEKRRVKIISEDDLLEMIRTRPAVSKVEIKPPKRPSEHIPMASASSSRSESIQSDDGILWIDKYKPTLLSQVVGQQTDKSPMKKLIYFLTNWYNWHLVPLKHKRQTTTTSSADVVSTDPSKFKAVLITGPPGVGKTLTAELVCKALNLPYMEQNASDNRSEITMEQIELGSVYLTEKNQTVNKHVLIIDEIDGVSGNEDRGGLQTLVELAQTTNIPLIFIANDRQAPKTRRLASYCYEIKFDRPSFLNVKSFILNICSHEHIRISHVSLDSLINVCNRDIRKIIHTLQLYFKKSWSIMSSATFSERALSRGPFDACMKMFSSSNINLIDKTNLYFHDSSLLPLLVQDNYIRVVPPITNERKPMDIKQRMELISKAADSLVFGDICSELNFTNKNRSLLSCQMRGHKMGEFIDAFIHKVTTDFKCSNAHITGVLITDNNGLILGSHRVNNDSNGAIAVLSDLSSRLLERPAIVCLENTDRKLIIREAGKAVFSVYMESTRR